MPRPSRVTRSLFNDQHDIGHSRLDEGAEEQKYPLGALSRQIYLLLKNRYNNALFWQGDFTVFF